jgi:hypothetical protein
MPRGRPKADPEWTAEREYYVWRIYEGARRSPFAARAMPLTCAEFCISRHAARHIVEALQQRSADQQPAIWIGSPSSKLAASQCGVEDLTGGMIASPEELCEVLKRHKLKSRGRPAKWPQVAAHAAVLVAAGTPKRQARKSAALAHGKIFDCNADRSIQRAWPSKKNN